MKELDDKLAREIATSANEQVMCGMTHVFVAYSETASSVKAVVEPGAMQNEPMRL